MDAPSMQLLAERLGLDQEDAQALVAGDLAPLLASRAVAASGDPLAAMLLTSMLKQRAESVAEADEGPTTVEALARARDTIRELKRHLTDADAMIAHLAETFGACSVCWGSSALCQRCHGTGKPGSSAPVEEELLAWVGPPLERLGLEVVRKQR
jgi:hypothetical protein